MTAATTNLPPLSVNGCHHLLPQHLADLGRSGLDETDANRLGIYSEADPARIAALLKQSTQYARRLGACQVIPFFDENSANTGYVRLRPDNPQKNKAGKAKKYEATKGTGNQAYFPPGTRAVLADPSIPLIICEGEKKAAAADKAGFPCVGISGVWNWCKKRKRRADGTPRGKAELIDSLAKIQWRGERMFGPGRKVFIAFDSDIKDNDSVLLAQYRFGEILKEQGAEVLAVELPPGPNGEKQGLDDYLLRHGAEALTNLLEEAKPPAKPESQKEHAPEAVDDQHRLGRLFLAATAPHPERHLLAYYRESFWRWKNNCWNRMPDSDFRAMVTQFSAKQLREDAVDALEDWDGEGKPPVARKVTLGLIGSVLQGLTGEVLVSQEIPQPVWLEDGRHEPRDYISLHNGILDITALMSGNRSPMRPHSPRWFSPVCLPYEFDPTATCPRWLAVLDRNLGGDRGKAVLLQQFIGYLLTMDTTLQKFLMMLGDGGNGKSVILAVIEAILGRDNISTVPLEMFSDKFRLHSTLGKLANITAEVGELDRIAEGQIKAFTTGDLMDFETKFKPAITARPTARLVLATNNPPTFNDKTDGVWRRALVLRFTVQIPPNERIAGMDKPEWWQEQGELPGIFNWAIAGLHAVRKQGGFTIPANCQAEVEKLRTEANPARRFLQEHYCYVGGDANVACEEAYQSYSAWCQNMGHHRLADIGFGREVSRLFPQVERRQKTLPAGRKWCYLGIALQEGAQAQSTFDAIAI